MGWGLYGKRAPPPEGFGQVILQGTGGPLWETDQTYPPIWVCGIQKNVGGFFRLTDYNQFLADFSQFFNLGYLGLWDAHFDSRNGFGTCSGPYERVKTPRGCRYMVQSRFLLGFGPAVWSVSTPT